MTLPRTATTRVVTQINRTAILDAVRQHGPLSRRDIQRHTGLSPATVERLTSALLTERSIVPGGMRRSSGGRPSALLRYAGEINVVAAVEVTATCIRGRLVDLDGQIVHECEGPATVEPGEQESATTSSQADATLALVVSLLAVAERVHKPCLGIGVSVPGVVSVPEGRVTHAVELGWVDIALGAILGARFGLPILIENDANAIAYGEWAQGAGKGTHSLAALTLGVDVGVGAGIVHAGEILRGHQSAAGEIGYLLVDRDAFGQHVTEHGDLEGRIAAAANGYARTSADTQNARVAEILRLAADGDPEAVAAADVVFDYFGLACAALCVVLDPEVIVLSGPLAHRADYTAAQLRRRLVGRIAFPPRVVPSELGAGAALVGIAQLTLGRVRSATYLS